MYNFFFFRKSCRLCDNVEKYCRAGQATGNNIIRRMRFACWITKATQTRSEYVIRAYCFSTATMVMQTHLIVTFIRIVPLLFVLIVKMTIFGQVTPCSLVGIFCFHQKVRFVYAASHHIVWEAQILILINLFLMALLSVFVAGLFKIF